MATSVVAKLRELYALDPSTRDGYIGYSNTISYYLGHLEKNPPADFSMETLDSYEDKLELAIVLAHIPSEKVYSELGDDALFWTWVEYPYSEQKEILSEGIGRVTGRDPEAMEKARLAAWQLLYTGNASKVKAIYDFSQSILGGGASLLDLASTLTANAKPGVSLPSTRIAQYCLVPLCPEGAHSSGYEARNIWGSADGAHKKYYLYLDTPIGLALTWKGEPNAILGLFPKDCQTLMIYQLQGVRAFIYDGKGKVVDRGSSRGLMPLDWQKLLVESAYSLGKAQGFAQLGIQGGRNNPWTEPYGPKDEIHLPLEEAVRRYDDVAKRLGFRPDKDRNWYKPIG